MKRPVTLKEFHEADQPPGWLGCILVLGFAGFICLIAYIGLGWLAGSGQ